MALLHQLVPKSSEEERIFKQRAAKEMRSKRKRLSATLRGLCCVVRGNRKYTLNNTQQTTLDGNQEKIIISKANLQYAGEEYTPSWDEILKHKAAVVYDESRIGGGSGENSGQKRKQSDGVHGKSQNGRAPSLQQTSRKEHVSHWTHGSGILQEQERVDEHQPGRHPENDQPKHTLPRFTLRRANEVHDHERPHLNQSKVQDVRSTESTALRSKSEQLNRRTHLKELQERTSYTSGHEKIAEKDEQHQHRGQSFRLPRSFQQPQRQGLSAPRLSLIAEADEQTTQEHNADPDVHPYFWDAAKQVLRAQQEKKRQGSHRPRRSVQAPHILETIQEDDEGRGLHRTVSEQSHYDQQAQEQSYTSINANHSIVAAVPEEFAFVPDLQECLSALERSNRKHERLGRRFPYEERLSVHKHVSSISRRKIELASSRYSPHHLQVVLSVYELLIEELNRRRDLCDHFPDVEYLRQCIVCTEELPMEAFPQKVADACLHEVQCCNTCLREWIATQLDMRGADGIGCPECAEPLSHHDIHAYADKEVAERYDHQKTLQYLATLPEFRWCMNPVCGSGQLHYSRCHGSKFTCIDCTKKYCLRHNIPWHSGMTCSDYVHTMGKTVAKQQKEEQRSEKWKGKETRVCVNGECGAPITKEGGCDHMVCAKCQTPFFWTTAAKYKQELPSSPAPGPAPLRRRLVLDTRRAN